MNTGVAVALIGAVGTLITAGAAIMAALITREQRRQKQEIDALSFLVSHFLPRWELNHLRMLATDDPFPFDKKRYPDFEHEVRQLRDRNLIVPKTNDFHLSNLPDHGDLHEYFRTSRDGETYLELWTQIIAKKRPTNA